MDDADIVTDREERFGPFMIASSKKPSGPVANGSCHYCGEHVEGDARFCDATCRDEWEREQPR